MSELLITLSPPSKVVETVASGGILFIPRTPQKSVGRPTVMTPDVIQKLEDAFMNSFTDREACFYAGIALQTLYNYSKEYPAFLERKENLKLSPNLIAKKNLVKGIDGSLDQSRWWAQHKMGDEFAPKTKTEHSGEVKTEHVDRNNPVIQGVVAEFEDKLKKAIVETHKEQPKP